jgi:hypothetical protein
MWSLLVALPSISLDKCYSFLHLGVPKEFWFLRAWGLFKHALKPNESGINGEGLTKRFLGSAWGLANYKQTLVM